MPIRINRVYTRTGDGGQTRLVGGKSVRKDAPRVEAYGTVDELNAVLGLARTWNDAERRSATGVAARATAELDEILRRIQNELFDLGSELATPPEGEWPGMIRIGDEQVRALERTIDRCQEELKPLRSFILPGGGAVAAFLHQARTVCRRAERRVLTLMDSEPIGVGALRYLNRLSDLLFVLGRWIARHTGSEEYLWEKGLQLEKPPTLRRRPKPTPRARRSKTPPRMQASSRVPSRKGRS